jgi:hypothetical protein
MGTRHLYWMLICSAGAAGATVGVSGIPAVAARAEAGAVGAAAGGGSEAVGPNNYKDTKP